MRKLRVVGLLLAAALLPAFTAQADAAKSQKSTIVKTAAPVWTLAMDGSRVAYASGGKIHVWNTATGATSVVDGKYGSARPGVDDVASQVAIAGKRVAWIKRQFEGNTEAGEKLYTASINGRAHLIDRTHRYNRDDPAAVKGGWIAGVVGTGKALAVSTWKTNGTVVTDEDLNQIVPAGLQPIVSGPGAIVAESADAGRLAVLNSPTAWPPDDLRKAASERPTVEIYSASGATLGEVVLDPTDASYVGTEIALTGNHLVVLTKELHEPSGPSTVTLQVYDWTTGALLDTWPVAISQYTGEVSLAAFGNLAAVEGPYRLHLVNLATGKDVAIAPSSRTDSPPALGARGLVYTVNLHYKGPGKLVFVPMSRLLALAD